MIRTLQIIHSGYVNMYHMNGCLLRIFSIKSAFGKNRCTKTSDFRSCRLISEVNGAAKCRQRSMAGRSRSTTWKIMATKFTTWPGTFHETLWLIQKPGNFLFTAHVESLMYINTFEYSFMCYIISMYIRVCHVTHATTIMLSGNVESIVEIYWPWWCIKTRAHGIFSTSTTVLSNINYRTSQPGTWWFGSACCPFTDAGSWPPGLFYIIFGREIPPVNAY